MKSRATRKFWRQFEALPQSTQEHAHQSYRQFQSNPAYPSLSFKRVDSSEPVYSVRIGINYRALVLLDGDTITWF
jgi:hypothetical protein